MQNLILDTSIVVDICLGKYPEIDTILQERRIAGLRNWISVGQQREILRLLILSAENMPEQDSHKIAKESLTRLLDECMWLSALSEEGDTLHDIDPGAAALALAARRLGSDTRVLTSDVTQLKRGQPFVDGSRVLNKTITESIEFIDLAIQQDRIRPQIEQNVFEILHDGRYVMGPKVAELEEELANFVGVKHCISVSSGTDALLVAMLALGIGVGDEVITTPFTFFAVTEMIILLGGVPIYVDTDPHTFNIDSNKIEAAITDRTRAIVPVSLFGQCADMDEINAVADRYNLPVVEDAAQSFGAFYKGRRSCSLSAIGCTSFFPAKPLGAYGDAGACFTDDLNLANSMQEISNHGQRGRYRHVRLGINGRMDTIQSGVLMSKLTIFDDELRKRNLVASRYNQLFSESVDQGNIKIPTILDHNVSSWAQYTVEVHEREKVQDRMNKDGIPTSVHYPELAFDQLVIKKGSKKYPNAQGAADKVISLPMHPYLKPVTQDRIVKSLIGAICA